MKKYTITWDAFYNCVFIVDESKFTEDDAKTFLEFYSWDYDEEGNLRLEALKKMAIKCFYLSQEWNVEGIMEEIDNLFECYIPIDGTQGVTLIDIDNFSFDSEDYEGEIEDYE